MSIVSLLGIKHRDETLLLEDVRNVRISHFSTPSSFYVQLVNEDKEYREMYVEMEAYYSAATLYVFCNKSKTLKATGKDEPFVPKLQLQDLQTRTYITLKPKDRWIRCQTQDNPRRCKMIDTGEIFDITPIHEKNGIYELEYRFLELPPRAILCGLASILPISQSGPRWSTRACDIFRNLTKKKPTRCYFVHKGLLQGTYYVFLTSLGTDGHNVHINTALCAFDTAMVDDVGLHHPIWPNDVPC